MKRFDLQRRVLDLRTPDILHAFLSFLFATMAVQVDARSLSCRREFEMTSCMGIG
jgi:hypothetical protein